MNSAIRRAGRLGCVWVILGAPPAFGGSAGLQPSFGARVFPTGSVAYRFAVIDLDGDAVEDVVTANSATGDVSVRLGTAAGLLGEERRYPAGAACSGIAAGDLDGDGAADIVTANYTDETLTVLRGQGDGTLAPPVAFAASQYVTRVALADLDEDGHLDAVTQREDNGSTALFIGRGDGSFEPQVPLATPLFNDPTRVVLADIDGDRHIDLVTTDRFATADLVIYHGAGDGSFPRISRLPVGVGTESLGIPFVADVDGDDLPDLLAGIHPAAQIAVLFGAGAGEFHPPVRLEARDTIDLAVADLTGDGVPDIAAARYGRSTLSIFSGLGNRSFAAPRIVGAAGAIDALRPADLDGDGLPELLALSPSGFVSVLPGRRGEPPRGWLPVDGDFDDDPVAVAVGDLDHDRRADLAVAHSTLNQVAVHLGDGTGRFGAATRLDAIGSPVHVAIADLGSDGVADVVAATQAPDELVAWRGVVADVPVFAGRSTAGGTPRDLLMTDLDGDGAADAIVGGFEAVRTLRGRGDGSFEAPRVALDSVSGGAVALADLDGDRHRDLVALVDPPGTLAVAFGAGDLTFGRRQKFRGGPASAADLAVGDLNGNRGADVVCGATADPASAFFGRGRCVGDCNGDRRIGIQELTRGVNLLLGNPTTACERLDDDRNGSVSIDELVAAVSLALTGCDAGPLLSHPEAFAALDGHGSVAVADVTADGRADLVATNSHYVTVIASRAEGFAPPEHFAAGTGCAALTIAKVDGDELPDLVCVNRRLIRTSDHPAVSVLLARY